MIQPTIIDFGERHHIARPEVFTSIDKIVRLLLQRTGDSSLRVRDITKAQLIEMARWSIVSQWMSFAFVAWKRLPIEMGGAIKVVSVHDLPLSIFTIALVSQIFCFVWFERVFSHYWLFGTDRTMHSS